MHLKKILISFFLLTAFYFAHACDCPPLPKLNNEYTNTYQLICKGSVQSITPCKDGIAKAHFLLQELYRGQSPKEIDVYFDCGVDCEMNFSAGQTWIIYGNYAQMGKPDVNFCSRSRKLVDNEIKLYTDYIPSDYSFDQEAEWLRSNLGLQAFLEENNNALLSHRNEIPSKSKALLLVGLSLAGLLLLYFLFNKFVK